MNEDVTFRKASLARLLKAALPHGAQLLAAALGLLTFAGVPLGGQAVAQSQFSFDQAGTILPAAWSGPLGPDSGQAAGLTMVRAWCSSNMAGLR